MAAVLAFLKKNIHLSTCISHRLKNSFSSTRLLVITQRRSFVLSASACSKFHHIKKKRKLKMERRERLVNRLEKLDPEDRPTGCLLCPKRGSIDIDYKNVRLLSQFVSGHTGRIYSREATGLCMYKQNEIKKAIKRSRSLGYMPYTMKYLSFHQDPRLF